MSDYQPIIVGVFHHHENIAATKKLIEQLVLKGKKTIGLEIGDNFFEPLSKYAKTLGLGITPIDSPFLYHTAIKFVRSIIRREKLPQDPERIEEVMNSILLRYPTSYITINLKNKNMLRQTNRQKPDIIIVGEAHASSLARVLHVPAENRYRVSKGKAKNFRESIVTRTLAGYGSIYEQLIESMIKRRRERQRVRNRQLHAQRMRLRGKK